MSSVSVHLSVAPSHILCWPVIAGEHVYFVEHPCLTDNTVADTAKLRYLCDGSQVELLLIMAV